MCNNQEIDHNYDLIHEYPIRICLYKIEKEEVKTEENYVSIIIHHIAFDGWSSEIFLEELESYYNYHLEYLEGKNPKLYLPELSIQYKDFALWQREYLKGDRLETQLDYWKNKLSDYQTLNLITDYPRPKEVDYKGKDVFFEIDEKTSESLRNLAKELNVSLYSLLLSGYYLMLRGYSNQDDLVLGTPIANRHYSQIENLIGLFVNTLALRIKIDPEENIKKYIQRVGRDVEEAQMHQDLPFEKLVEELKVEKDTSRHPIFQVVFGLEDFTGKLEAEKKEDGIKISALLKEYTGEIGYNIAKFDLSVFIEDKNASLLGNFNYATTLYKKETIQGHIETYTEILRQLAELSNNETKQNNSRVKDIKYLSNIQYTKVIEEWNKTEKEYPRDKTIQELFEEQVEKTPDNIAVVYEGRKLTYRELNEKANQLAHYILERHRIKPDTLIGLCLDRSENMLIGILATLKTGAAYVPMDPNYPNTRIQYILEDTKANLVLTNEEHRERLEEIVKGSVDILGIDQEDIQIFFSEQISSNPKTETTSEHLAYIIYT